MQPNDHAHRLGLSNVCWYALSDLRHRLSTTALNVAAVAVAAVYVLVFGYYGACIYRHQAAVVNRACPAKVIAFSPDLADASMRFTSARLDALQRSTKAAMVRPHVELIVRVSLEGHATTADVTAEGVLPGEPEVSGPALVEGAGLATAGERAVLVAPALLRKLGGVDSASTVVLEIRRSVDGRDEVSRVSLRIAGLLQGDSSDERVFIPLALAESLDLWATNKTTALGDDTAAPTTYAWADAYVPASQERQAVREAAAMHVTLERDGEMSVPHADPTTRPASLLVRFRVRDERTPGGRVDDKLVGLIAMSRPTFVDCRGHQSVTASIAGKPVKLLGVAADDLRRFEVTLTQGQWLAVGDSAGIVLPLAMATQWGDHAVGAICPVRIYRDGGAAGLDLLLTVVGVGDVAEPMITTKLADDVALWQAGKRVYNETRNTFDSPPDVARRAGSVRAAIYAADVAALPGLVKQLRDLGYRTQDRLAEQEGLERLQQALFLIGGGAVGGCLLLSAAFIGLGTALNYQTKGYEIAILRAHGVGARDVLGVFAAQGLAIGLMAMGVALVAAGSIEPLVTALLGRAVSASAGEVFRGSPLGLASWWIWLIALGVCVLFSLGGVLVPGWRACRRPLLGEMRRRE